MLKVETLVKLLVGIKGGNISHYQMYAISEVLAIHVVITQTNPSSRQKIERDPDPDKMASISITKELLSLVSPYNYSEHIRCLDTDDFVTIRKFRSYDLGYLFNINKENCIRDGEINNDHLYELFGRYSEEDVDAVRSDVVERIGSGKHVYTKVGEEFFNRRGWSFTEWGIAVCSQFYYGDEMLLYTLCRVFHRHALVVCRDWYWCTFDIPKELSIGSILDTCDLHLIYLRPGIFAELTLKKETRAIE